MLRENDRGHKSGKRENVEMTDAGVGLQVRLARLSERRRARKEGSALNGQASHSSSQFRLRGVLDPLEDGSWRPATHPPSGLWVQKRKSIRFHCRFILNGSRNGSDRITNDSHLFKDSGSGPSL